MNQFQTFRLVYRLIISNSKFECLFGVEAMELTKKKKYK